MTEEIIISKEILRAMKDDGETIKYKCEKCGNTITIAWKKGKSIISKR